MECVVCGFSPLCFLLYRCLYLGPALLLVGLLSLTLPRCSSNLRPPRVLLVSVSSFLVLPRNGGLIIAIRFWGGWLDIEEGEGACDVLASVPLLMCWSDTRQRRRIDS